MNDENEFDGAGSVEADRSELRDEGPDLTDLLKQASRLLRRKLAAAAAAGEFGNRGRAIREEVDAVIDEALSDEELETLTDSLSRIVDTLGRNAEGADDECNDRREFAGRRGYAARREFARRFARAGGAATYREYGLGRGFGPSGDRKPRREWSPRQDRNRPHGWGPRGGWGSREDWGEGLADEGRFDHRRSHEAWGPEVHGADHRGHRLGSRRRGMGRMAGAAFEHGFAAGYEHGARS
ncbi:hypothetical protein [Brevibacterium marinum]|uniref:Uncharacterized protein n=1 Tax=Brevibacterium marinum TaxID=418643 RepID=A0A846S2V1_9MICO|nr:hypothetical protein [Brevibacterium marinum]NJC55882.1 hypothetical protein [Brevibacterium marinum]